MNIFLTFNNPTMNNKALCSAIGVEAEALGYSFSIDEHGFEVAHAPFPFALLAPPRIHEAEGRRHGRITYDVTLKLAEAAADRSPEARRDLRNRLEADAVALFVALSQHERILAVENLTAAVEPYASTNRGDLTLTAKAHVITLF